MSFRQILIKLHLYVAFVTAIPLLVVAITGALLVYGEEIDGALDPERAYVTPRPARQPLQKILDTVRAAHPDQPVLGFGIPTEANRSYALLLRDRHVVQVDPYTAEILGRVHMESTVRRKLFLLHTRLMAGATGRWIVFGSTVLTLFMVVSGIVLWWRRKITAIKLRTSWKRVNFDLHNVTGLYPSVVLVLLAVTGILISFGHDPPEVPQSRGPAGATPPPLDEVVGAAERAMPNGRITFVGLPSRPEGVFQVYASVPEDPTGIGRGRIYVDQYSGDVLGTFDVRQASRRERLEILVEPIHFGDIFGTPTRIIALVSCLLLAGQVVSGMLIWWNAGRRSAAGVRERDRGPAARAVVGLRRPAVGE